MSIATDRTGRRFGDLAVLRRVGTYRGQAVWLCARDDGMEVTKTSAALTAIAKRQEDSGELEPWATRRTREQGLLL